MTVEEILELMDELLDKSSSVPFSQKKMIDVEPVSYTHLTLPTRKPRRS